MTVLVDVDNLDQFVRILVAWHGEKVKLLEHFLTLPEGVEVTYQDDKPEILTGELHRGFMIGLTLGLMELGNLPFLTEFEPDDKTPGKPDETPAVAESNQRIH
jgi:hypothetical protein